MISVNIHFSFSFLSALFGRIAGLYGPMDLAGNRRDSLSTESEDNSYPFSPVLTNLGNVDDIFADFDSDFLPPGSPHSIKFFHQNLSEKKN